MKMNAAAVYHHCGDAWCSALDAETLLIRIRTARDDIDRIDLVYADPFEWDRSGTEAHWNSVLSPMTICGKTAVHDYWEARISPPYGRLKYWFILNKGRQAYEFGEKGIVETVDRWNTWNTFIFPYIQPTEVFHAPDWVAGTVWYQIFPERYHNGNGDLNPRNTLPWHHGPVTNGEFYGGNIPGITAKLDHIAELGFTGIYLTPIFDSPSVHKYDTRDYMKIDPSFGSEADLKELVRKAHAKGIRVILDAVFNHSGRSFGPWQDVLEKGEESRYRDWFVIKGFPIFGRDPGTGAALSDTGDSHGTNLRTFAFTTGMPKLNTTNPEVREYLLNVAEYWIRTCDIDGWRLDVANEVDHEFWRHFRKRVKAVKRDAFIVGEIWHHSMDWLRGDQYDAIMNYHFGQAVVDFLNESAEIPDALALAHRFTTLEMSYPPNVVRNSFNLLDSHDTPRLIHQVKDNIEAARQAWLLLAVLPAPPCFYYGSEFGITGGYDPDCRRCMPWDASGQTPGQFGFIKEIVALRKDNSVLINRGKREWLASRKSPGLFGVRITESPDTKGLIPEGKPRSITVLINRSKKDASGKDLSALLLPGEIDDQAFRRLAPNGFAWRAK